MKLPHPAILGAIYGVSEIFLGFTRCSKGESKSRDRGSLAVLWSVIVSSIFVAVWAVDYRAATLPYQRIFYVAGLILFVGGIGLRWYSIWKLGRFFTVDVAIAEQHSLIDSGPYRWIRHPSYTGAMMAFFGFGLCLGNGLSIFCLMVPITAAFLWRIRVEEDALITALGDDYRAYIERTKRLVPFLL